MILQELKIPDPRTDGAYLVIGMDMGSFAHNQAPKR